MDVGTAVRAKNVPGADFRVDGGIHNGAGNFLFRPKEARNVRTFDGFHRDEPPELFARIMRSEPNG